MGNLNNINLNKPRGTSFPVIENVVITSASSLIISCTGDNSVNYLFVSTGDSGVIDSKEQKEFITNEDPITDTIQFTFNAPSNIEVSYSTGTGGGGGGGGTATDTNQVIIINILNGNLETISLFEETTVGVKNTDTCLALSMVFQGTNGVLDGIIVANGFTISYSGTERNEIRPISYEVPTIPDGLGQQRVLISYTKI